jgi:hypothetical protein
MLVKKTGKLLGKISDMQQLTPIAMTPGERRVGVRAVPERLNARRRDGEGSGDNGRANDYAPTGF